MGLTTSVTAKGSASKDEMLVWGRPGLKTVASIPILVDSRGDDPAAKPQVLPFRQDQDHVVVRSRPLLAMQDRIRVAWWQLRRLSGCGLLTLSVTTLHGVIWGQQSRIPDGYKRPTLRRPFFGSQDGSDQFLWCFVMVTRHPLCTRLIMWP
jgi:hypothetical protein